MSKRKSYGMAGALILVAVLAFADLLAGGVTLSLSEVLQGLSGKGVQGDIMLGIRVPRMLMALVAGASLGLSGCQMQAVFRNPLADPHIMGVSGGAGLGAALASVSAAGTVLGMAGAAFAGALTASVLITLAGKRLRSGPQLLIFGVLLGFIFAALTSVTEYTASQESVKIYYNWAAGSFTLAGKSGTMIAAGALALSLVVAMVLSRGLDLLLFGDEFTRFSGASPHKIRICAILGCSLCTGAVTAFCGPLGFAGIIAPHLARWTSGTSAHATTLPLSMVWGGAITLLADIVSFLFPTPVPAGSALALLGIPVVAVLMFKRSGFDAF